MKTHFPDLLTPASAILAALVVSQGSDALAQTLDVPGTPRTQNERVTIESPKPPSATTEASRVAQAMSPGGVRSSQMPDVAMLAEHAVGMAIEGSTLLAIIGPDRTAEPDPVKHLRNKARKLMIESQSLLGQAAADSRALENHPAAGRFHTAANLYVTTLAGLQPAGPAETAQVAMINQAVKDVLDAEHIRQMTPATSGSAPLEQLRNHAAMMKTQGSELIRRMAADSRTDVAIPVPVTTLATRGRQLLDAAEELGRLTMSATIPGQSNLNNPGRFQNDRPEIIGGTYGTGNPRLGVYTTPATKPAGPQSEPSAIPNNLPTNSNQTTGSTGGARPQ